jgi:hypothetical protein
VGRDVPLDDDDPNATPDGNNSDSDGPAPLIDSDSEDDEVLRNRYGLDSDEDTDKETAAIVVQDNAALEDEEFERLPADITAPDIREHDHDFPIHDGDIDAVYSRDFLDIAAEAFAMRHLTIRKPKLKSCDTRRRAKVLSVKHLRANKKARERVSKSKGPAPENFGDQVTLEQIIARNVRNVGFRRQTAALTMVNRMTGFKWGEWQKLKTGAANLEVLQRFQGPDEKDKIKYIWSDAAPDIIYATTRLGIRGNHDTSAVGDSQGDGNAENNNRDIKMGTESLLAHAGVPLAFWPLAMPCYCFGQNAAIMDGTSPYCKRFGDIFDQSKMSPFGAEVRFAPNKITSVPRFISTLLLLKPRTEPETVNRVGSGTEPVDFMEPVEPVELVEPVEPEPVKPEPAVTGTGEPGCACVRVCVCV